MKSQKIMRKQFILNIIFQFSFLCLSYGQFDSPTVTVGMLFSDVYSNDVTYENCNSSKRNFFGTIGTNYVINNLFDVGVNLTYQERKALEIFSFPIENQGAGISSQFSFCKYPTSPQSDIFHNSVNQYRHFPNFKYFHLEFIPSIRYGTKLEFKLGVGLFVGMLLNKNQVIFREKDFPNEATFFQPPHNVGGEVAYYKYDFGWVPKISFDIRPKENIKLGASIKSYFSISRLNDTFVVQTLNMHWKTLMIGLNLKYDF